MAFNASAIGPTSVSTHMFHDVEMDERWLEAYKIYFYIVDSVFILPTILGNILILMALWRIRALRQATSCILIGNLAMSDLLVGAVVFPVDLLTLSEAAITRGLTYCLVQQCCIYTLLVISILNLFILSLERFHAITRPLIHASVFTKRRVYIMCAVIWIVVLAFGFSPLLFGWHDDIDVSTFVCRGSAPSGFVYEQTMKSIAVGSLIINAVLFFILVRVTLKATSKLKLGGSNARHWSNQRLRRDIRHTKMMLIVSGLFIVLWGPFCVLVAIPRHMKNVRFAANWLSSLGMINSSTNWIIYGLRSKKFRFAFLALLKMKAYSISRQAELSTSMSS